MNDELKTKHKRVEEYVWLIVESVPAFLTVAFAAYVLMQSQRQTLKEIEVLLWMLSIIALLAMSELVERLRLFRRIDSASSKTLEIVERISVGDAESMLRDRSAGMDLPKTAKRARRIWACGYSLINLVNSCEGFFAARLEDGCELRFLVLDPASSDAVRLDKLVTARPGELIADVQSSLARLDRVRSRPHSPERGQLDIHLLRVAPTCSLIIVDPDGPDGYVQVEPYPPYQGRALDRARPHFILARTDGRWYRFFYDQFRSMWDDRTYSEPYTQVGAAGRTAVEG